MLNEKAPDCSGAFLFWLTGSRPSPGNRSIVVIPIQERRGEFGRGALVAAFAVAARAAVATAFAAPTFTTRSTVAAFTARTTVSAVAAVAVTAAIAGRGANARAAKAVEIATAAPRPSSPRRSLTGMTTTNSHAQPVLGTGEHGYVPRRRPGSSPRRARKAPQRCGAFLLIKIR